jgi:hypothetical protein
MRRLTKSSLAVAAALAVSAGGTFFAGAGSALAPEPARLASTLASTGSTAATLIYSRTVVPAYFLSSSWTPSSMPAGLPCSTTAPVPSGTVLTHYVVASGNYRKCQ